MKNTLKIVTPLLYLALCIFLIIFLSACGEGVYSSSETGSIAFSVELQGAHNESSVLSQAIDCGSSGVSTVEAQIYDVNDSLLASGGPWNCGAHSGTITGVPAGSNRKVVILGKDSSGDVLYRGEKTGINVSAGQTSSAGTIVASLFCPTPTAPEDGSTVQNGAFSCEWNPIAGTAEYQIQVSTGSTFETTAIDTTTVSTTYGPPELSYGETYYWRVKAKDSYGNQSIWSDVWNFTVSAEPGTGPSAPTNVAASAGDSQVTISWDSVSGATSYNIYWSTSSGVTKSTGTKLTNVSSPYIHTGRTNGTTYYYVVTAENSYGESGESNEVNAKPSSTWTMLNLPDTGQTQSYTETFGEDSDYTINPPSYTDNDDETVTDNVTGLMWQQEDDDTARTWDDATSYCEDLALAGYSDWRLPSAMELMSIVDYGTYSPSIDTTYFSGTSALYYWSSTTYAYGTSEAWGVFFSYGRVYYYSKSGGYYVRCVRGGQ